MATSECPFLEVKEEGSYEYRYYCRSCEQYIGKTSSKQFVENVCRCGENFYEDCYAYKGTARSPGISPDAEKVWGKRSSPSSSDSASSSSTPSYSSSRTQDSGHTDYNDSPSGTYTHYESSGTGTGDFSWGRLIFWALVILSPILLILGIIDGVQYIFHAGVLDKHNNPFVEQVNPNRVHVGDILEFGSYEQDAEKAGLEDIEWIVLVKEDGRMLLLSRYAIDCQEFNITDETCTWETSSLRRYLNWTFYEEAFTDSEKARIQTVTLDKEVNPAKSDRIGNATTDRVFLLSIDEAEKYFASDSKRECLPTAYAKERGVWSKRRYYYACNWWLRTPAMYADSESVVYFDGTIGYDSARRVSNNDTGVRPAIWVVFDPVDNDTTIEPDLWYVGDEEIKNPFSDDFETTTVWPGSKPTDLVTLAQNRLAMNDGNHSSVIWSSGKVRDVYWNEYQGYISFFVSEERLPCPDITLDPGGENMILDAWFFLAGNYTDRETSGGVTDPEESLGLRFYGDGQLIYDTGLIRSIDGAHELHLDLSGVNALRIELYAGNKRWGTVSRIFLSGAVRDKSVPSALPQPIPPERPDTIRLVDLAKRYVASNWSAPEGNFSDFTTDSVSDPRGNTYAGCLYFGMSKHNESAPWHMLDLGGVYRSLDFKCYVSARYALQKGPDDKFGLRFYGDGSQIFDTGYISGDMSARSFHVDVTGFKTIRLELYTAGSTSHDARLYLVDGILSK